jgi:hypothetical protein
MVLETLLRAVEITLLSTEVIAVTKRHIVIIIHPNFLTEKAIE